MLTHALIHDNMSLQENKEIMRNKTGGRKNND